MRRDLPRGVYRSGDKFRSKVKLPSGRWEGGTFDTPFEAEQWFLAAKRALAAGKSVPDPRRPADTSGGRYMTVEDLVVKWIDYHYTDDCNPDTKATTARNAHLHVLPLLGHRTLISLTIQDVDELANKVHSALEHNSAEKMCWILRASLHYAHQRGWVDTNVAALPGRRKRPPAKKAMYLSLADTRRAASRLRSEFRIGIWIQRLCGLRVGELFGLQIRDIDLDTRILTLVRQGGTASRRADSEGFIPRLKEDKELRLVGIPEVLVGPIRDHIRLHLPHAGARTRLIPSIQGGTAYDSYTSAVARAVAQIGVEDPYGRSYRTHWLRASMLTDLRRSGVNPRDISEVGGHSTSDPAAGSPITFRHYILDMGDVQVQLQAALAIHRRVHDELDGDIFVVQRGAEWVPLAEAAHELGVGVESVRKQVREGKLVAETTRDPGHNVKRTWVLRSSLDARIATLAERVTLTALAMEYGMSVVTVASVVEHLGITPIGTAAGIGDI